MAAINVVLNGVFTTDAGTSTGSFIGQLAYSDRGVGGGPIMPPDQGGGGKPPGIWGPTDPRPTPPIANVPGLPPTQNPPGFGDHPAHPIVLPPDPPIDPPTEPPTNPPDANWEWGWSPAYGWHPVFTPGDKPQPPPIGGNGGNGGNGGGGGAPPDPNQPQVNPLAGRRTG